MPLGDRLRWKLIRSLLPSPIQAEGLHYTLAGSIHDDPAQPSQRLLDLALAASAAAGTIPLAEVSQRLPGPPDYPSVWPGEHYRLLAGLMRVLQPRSVVEVGTGSGLSALAMLAHLPSDSRLATFDITPWRRSPGSVLSEQDFADGRLVQHLDDLTDPAMLDRHRSLLESAEFLFIDAAKDGRQEAQLLAGLERLSLNRPLVMLDDTRFYTMLAVWRGIRRPKLDLTSFGHWSGTGWVDWC